MSNCGTPAVILLLLLLLPDPPGDELAARGKEPPRASNVGYPWGKADVNRFDMVGELLQERTNCRVERC